MRGSVATPGPFSFLGNDAMGIEFVSFNLFAVAMLGPSASFGFCKHQPFFAGSVDAHIGFVCISNGRLTCQKS